MIYVTGDLPGHNVWNQTRADQTRVQEYVNAMLVKYFPGKVVLPTIGNHESSPVNRCAQLRFTLRSERHLIPLGPT